MKPPKEHNWLYVSLRDFIADWGDLKSYKMVEFFDVLTNSIKTGKNLFDEAKAYIGSEKVISAHRMIVLRPGIFGISFDLKEAFNFFKELKRH